MMSLEEPPPGYANKTAKFKNIFLHGKSRVLASLYNIYRRCMYYILTISYSIQRIHAYVHIIDPTEPPVFTLSPVSIMIVYNVCV